MRRRSWSARHDNPGGYQHGDFKRSYPGDGRCRRAHRALNGCTERGPRMDKQKVRDRIAEIGVVPVVRASSPEQALLAAEAVCRGGIPIVEFAVREGVLIMAGALTPTEVITAWSTGSDFVKIFPCGLVGGAKYIKALKGPLPQVPLVPTGGVNLNTAAEFIEAGAAALGIGGELVQSDALRAGKTEVIVENARKFLAVVKEARARMTASAAAKGSC